MVKLVHILTLFVLIILLQVNVPKPGHFQKGPPLPEQEGPFQNSSGPITPCANLSGAGWDGHLLYPAQGPIRPGRWFRLGHTGIDIEYEMGQEVWSAEDGYVIFAGEHEYSMGNAVALAHGGGWVTVVAHLSEVLVTCEQYVAAGQVVGLSGMSGATTFPHVHFEVRNGDISYNPRQWLE